MSPVAKGELRREAGRLLPRLAQESARLEPLDGGAQYGLRTARSRGGKPRIRVSARTAEALRREGLLETDAQGTLRLSLEGMAWVARRSNPSDGFRAQHRIDGERWIDADSGTGNRARGRVRVNLAETPLGWLRRRKGADGRPLISEEQYEAGERLRADFTRAQMMPRTTADWTMPLRSSRRHAASTLDPSEAALAARQRFYRALDAVGPGLAEPLVDVCCYMKGMEEAERLRGWPPRAGKVVLAIALERLADHYGLNGGGRRPIA